HRRVRTETDRMAGLVDDLFELSRIHAGALELRPVTVALADVVGDAVEFAGPIARAKRVCVEAADADWPMVHASEPELARIVTNLLPNASRHTPADGTVTVRGGHDAAGVWLTVTDACGGIPEADLPRVFDVAFRGAPARTPALGNAQASGGLGL